MLMAKLRSNSAFKELDENVEKSKKETKDEKQAIINSYTQ
jgi:hypothetical protein